MNLKIITLFLRISLAGSFLSAVADRLRWWPKDLSVWGNWNSFLEYVQLINPCVPSRLIPFLGWTATFLEIILAVGLLVGYRLKWFARASGVLLLLFALAMTFSTGIKSALDYSVFTAAAAAFALSVLSAEKVK